jgi:hypothetical protein
VIARFDLDQQSGVLAPCCGATATCPISVAIGLRFVLIRKSAGGAEGDRTPDLVIANDALSQLSYSPVPPAVNI